MLFQSIKFAVFLPVVFILYWLLPHRFRYVLLLAANAVFYLSWDIRYGAFLLFATLVSYFAALALERCSRPATKKWLFVLSILVSLTPLLVFKYTKFFFDSAAAVLSVFSVRLHPFTAKLLLPVGISFYTFQSLGYLIDVAKQRIKAERHFGYYALFVTFFPQLLSGPIGRAESLLPQYKQERFFSYAQATEGLKQMVWGFFKKLVVADALAAYVDLVYGNLSKYQGFSLVLIVFFYSIQIYCDFSGYTDIAIGSAKLLGISLPENFRLPYFSTSIREFWSRWHISLSTWFRDYLYIPLGGSRVAKPRHYFNLLVTFLVSGLWHGASWTFLLWGGLHALAQILEKMLGIRSAREKGTITRLLRALPVFLFVSAAWVFFRAESFSDAIYVFSHLFSGITHPLAYLKAGFLGACGIGMGKAALLNLVLFALLPLIVTEFAAEKHIQSPIAYLSGRKPVVQWIVFLILVCLTVFLSKKGVAAEFVYLQF